MSVQIDASDRTGVRDTSNGRVVEVVNFLASHPTESFTLSQIATQLRLSQGSAHRVLTTLTAAGYLSRHPRHKTYALGLALVMIGQAALEKHHSINVARRAMARLTDDLKVQCSATAVVDDEMLLVAREGLPQTAGGLSRVGERRPFVAPYGLPHIAWAGEQAIAIFLSKTPVLAQRSGDFLRAAIALVRQRGYSMAAEGFGQRALRHTIRQAAGAVHDAGYWQAIDTALAGLSDGELQLRSADDVGPEGICYISAPVFAANGSVAIELTLGGLPAQLGAAEIDSHAARLCAVAALVTSESHGRPPA